MSIFPKNYEIYLSICVEMNDLLQKTEYGNKNTSLYDYCAYGDYEKDAYDFWYTDYILTNGKRPLLEDIEWAIKEIQMKRDSFLSWNDEPLDACPNCGEKDDISWESFIEDGITYYGTCNKCGKTWRQCYSFQFEGNIVEDDDNQRTLDYLGF